MGDWRVWGVLDPTEVQYSKKQQVVVFVCISRRDIRSSSKQGGQCMDVGDEL